jgi:hypothetical protein
MNVCKILPALLMLLLVVLAAPLLRADTINASLTHNTLMTTAGSTITFQVNLSNSSNSATFLNSDSSITSSPFIKLNDAPFFSLTFPGVIANGGSVGPIDLFNIIVAANAAPGIYTGTFTIFGGKDLGSFTDLADLNFTVKVTSSTGVPESGTLSMLLFGVALTGTFLLFLRQFTARQTRNHTGLLR